MVSRTPKYIKRLLDDRRTPSPKGQQIELILERKIELIKESQKNPKPTQKELSEYMYLFAIFHID